MTFNHRSFAPTIEDNNAVLDARADSKGVTLSKSERDFLDTYEGRKLDHDMRNNRAVGF